MAPEQTPSKQRSQSVASAIFNPKEGTFLGRTAGSWGRILFFYLIYYSFLGLLFWGTIELINYRIKNINEGEFPAINTRLDEPGLTVYPHNTIIGDELNEQLDYSYGDLKKQKNPSDQQKEWKEENEYVISQYQRRIINPNLKKCAKSDQVYKQSVKLNKMLVSGFKSAKPMFALKINRVHKWTPVTVRSAEGKLKEYLDLNKAQFTKNVVYFSCEEAKAKNGEEGVKNLKNVYFYNPSGKKDGCGLKQKTKNVGCVPASVYYASQKSTNPRFMGYNPFTAVASEEEKKWGDAYIPGCWPFAFGQVEVKDKTKPVAVKCQVHLENVNSQMDIPANYGWVKFGFKGNDYNKKN